MKSPLNHGGEMQSSDDECEFLRPVSQDNFAVFHSEIVQDVSQFGLGARLLLVADELAIIFQYEIPFPPVLEMFSWKNQEHVMTKQWRKNALHVPKNLI